MWGICVAVNATTCAPFLPRETVLNTWKSRPPARNDVGPVRRRGGASRPAGASGLRVVADDDIALQQEAAASQQLADRGEMPVNRQAKQQLLTGGDEFDSFRRGHAFGEARNRHGAEGGARVVFLATRERRLVFKKCQRRIRRT